MISISDAWYFLRSEINCGPPLKAKAELQETIIIKNPREQAERALLAIFRNRFDIYLKF